MMSTIDPPENANDVEVIFGDVTQQPGSPSGEPKSPSNSKQEVVLPIQIQLRAPEKVGEGIMNTHIEYKVQVKTSMSQYKSNDFSCVRRYKDFLWLRDQLLENHKGYLIPPLPEKQIINRFNAEFVEYRRRELEKFLYRIISHPALIGSPALQKFLESTDSPSDSGSQKAQKSEGQSGGGSRFFSMINSTVESISSMTGSQNEPDQWFEAKKNYINALENQLTGLAKATNKLILKQKELGQAYAEFGVASSLLSSTEADHSPWVSNSFNKLAEMTTQMSNLHEALVDNETVFFEDSIRDYVRILGAAKEMLQARAEKLAHYQNATKSLEAKKEKRDKGKGNAKLDKEIEDGERKVDDTRAEFNNISDICKSEIGRFESTKADEIKRMLVKLTQTNINYELQILDQWKKYLDNELSSDPSESSA